LIELNKTGLHTGHWQTAGEKTVTAEQLTTCEC